MKTTKNDYKKAFLEKFDYNKLQKLIKCKEKCFEYFNSKHNIENLSTQFLKSVRFQATWNSICVVLLFGLLLMGIFLRLVNINDVGQRTFDEQVYKRQAMAIVKDGIGCVKLLVREYNSKESQNVFPPPTRIGYTYFLAKIMKITNVYDERSGTYLSTICSIATLFVIVILGLRFFTKGVTIVALALMSVSPMDLQIASRCWQDSMMGFVSLLLIYCCCELTNRPKRMIWYIPFLFVGIWCIHELKPKIKNLDPDTAIDRIFAEASPNNIFFFGPDD